MINRELAFIEEMVTISRKEYEALLPLVGVVKQLKLRISQLEEEVRLLKNGKRSATSHTPPSQDIGRPNQRNSRVKSDKKSGGQNGHKGSTLEMKAVADEIIDHVPHFCGYCSGHLSDTATVLEGCRQELVIPPIKVKYVEHRSYSKTCPHCKYISVGSFPDNIVAPIQYGESVSATVAYLSACQYLPYQRIKLLMKDLFGISLSEGTINNILNKMAQRALPVYSEIQQRIVKSNWVGADETGTKINSQKGWLHVWQNSNLTFIVSSLNRGYATIEKYFEDGFEKAIYVSDCWAAQLKVPAASHQLCLAHLLRELSNFEQALKCEWSTQMKELLQEAIKLEKSMKPPDYCSPSKSVLKIESDCQKLLEVDTELFHKKVKAFIKRLQKNKEYIFSFLYYPDVPFDNNSSERAIRNVKVKNKISGCFRSTKGAFNFAVLRSVIDTTIKNSKDVFSAMKIIAQTRPE